MFFVCPTPEWHSIFTVTNRKDEDLWEDISNVGTRPNGPLGLRHRRLKMVMNSHHPTTKSRQWKEYFISFLFEGQIEFIYLYKH